MFEFEEFAKTIAYRVGYAIFAAVMIGTIFAYDKFPAVHWWLMSAMFGVFAYSVTYAMVFASVAKDALPDGEEVSHIAPEQPAQTEQPTQPQPQEPQETAVIDEHERLWRNGLLRTVGGNMVRIPDDVDIDHLVAIKVAVAAGKLHDGLSPNRLDSEKVVSRHTDEPNAYTVVDFLVEAGILQDNGTRKMYTWTGAGRRVFGVPSPTEPINPLDFSRVPEVGATDPTGTTGYATHATG